jgi:hypothetical protein
MLLDVGIRESRKPPIIAVKGARVGTLKLTDILVIERAR